MQTRFQGIVPPLVTPFEQHQPPSLDLAGMEDLVEHMINGGVHGIFALGTTGEGPSLPMSLRHQTVTAVCDQAAGRLPVLVGVTDTIFSASLELAESSHAAGAAAIVLAPPYYLPMTQGELQSYCERLAERSPLPLMLYNMPGCCKVVFEPATVAQLSQHEKIVGLKDSSGDLAYFSRVVEQLSDTDDFDLLVGPEEILVDAMRRGCGGGVHGGANLFPELYVAMYEAAAAEKWQEADELQRVVRQVGEQLYSVSDGPSRIIKGIKSGLSQLGICGPEMAEPFTAHTQDQLELIASRVEKLQNEIGQHVALRQRSRP